MLLSKILKLSYEGGATTGGAAKKVTTCVHKRTLALILALARFEIASKEQARALEKEWAEYRKQQRLDVEGGFSFREVCQR
jgi:hypothetical protein